MKKEEMARFDRLEAKIDKLMEEIVPAFREKIATIEEKSSSSARIITGIGGAITLLLSVAAAHYVK